MLLRPFFVKANCFMCAQATDTFRQPQLFIRALTLLVWFACAVGMVYWVFKFMAQPPQWTLEADTVVTMSSADRTSLERMLGMRAHQGRAHVAAITKKMELVGVVAQKTETATAGAALIAIENEGARPYRVGQTVVDGYVLQTLDHQRAVLVADDGREDRVLDMPREYQSGSGARVHNKTSSASRAVSATRPPVAGTAANGRRPSSDRRS